MKYSLITTVLNEEKTIHGLLQSILQQTVTPHECIIVDGGSTDGTVSVINKIASRFDKKKIKLIVLTRSGNRSIGRNEAIRHARGDIILCTDAGCVLDETWINEITKPFVDGNVDVVSGYYQGRYETVFQKCLIPYVLVMEDNIQPEQFLPSTRSMAFRKSIWKAVKGFPVKYSHNEDYVFAKSLQKIGARMVFVKEAIVYWLPRKTIKEAYIMFYRFAFGDAEAGLFRPKVVLIFIRYVLALALFISYIYSQNSFILIFLLILLLLYILWAVLKNFRHVKEDAAVIYLPLIQVTADIAVLHGTTLGMLNRVWDTWVMQ